MLKKVIFEYSDGSRKYIDGEALARWTTFNSQVATFAHTHNLNPPWDTVKWKDEGQIINNEQKNTKENKESENTGKEN